MTPESSGASRAEGNAHGYALARTQREHDRLVRQSRLWDPATRLALERIGLPRGGRALDVGCGPGEVLRLIAERVGPAGHVVGLDIDAEIGRRAVERLQGTGVCNATFVHGDASRLTRIDGGPFDLVFARLLLFHVRDPAALLRRLWEWVRPGGVLLVMDYDTTVARGFPPAGAVERALDLARDAFRRAGCDIEIGARMPCVFAEAGVGPPDACETASVTLPAPPATAMLRDLLDSLRPVIEREALADAAALRLLDEELERAARSDLWVRCPDMVATWKRRTLE
jgi:ubiquinone/menaquinone biosynthesis C-methylase UbiE